MILITGYRGFVGSHLYSHLEGARTGIDVREGYNLLSCDLPKGITLIYHLASQSSVEASWHDPMHDADNLKMTVRLVHEYPDARIIYTNSAASLDKTSPYGFSKWAAGEYIKKFHNDYVICTMPNVYGPGSRSVVDIFKGRSVVKIYGDGEQLRDYVHVDDVVKALVKAADWPKGEYSFGTGNVLTVNQLAKGKEVIYEAARREARESVLPNTTPDWKPTIDVTEYLHENNTKH